MGDKKDKRGPNFSESDKQLLLKLTNDNKHIIENKKTDGCTWRQKEEAWKKIEKLFNSSTTGVQRNAKQLKFKYEAIKRNLKKERAQHKAYARGTGGGEFIPPPISKTEEEVKLLQTIEVSAEGLTNPFDSDGLAGITGTEILSDETTPQTCSGSNVVELDMDWSNPTPQMLKMPIHETLQQKSSAINDKNSWSSRRRPSLHYKASKSSASATFEVLANKKIELVEIQMEKERLNTNHVKETNQLQLDILRLNKEEAELKVELLKKQLGK